MRLKREEITIITECIKALDKDAKIYLFGSRVDDTVKGGDIDMLIISQKLGYDDSIRIRQILYEKIGEQKIHIIITKDIDNPFVKIAHAEGVLL